jgi:hypothetical protein
VLTTGSYPVIFVASQNTFNQYAPQLLQRPNKKSNEFACPRSVVSEPQLEELQQMSSIIVCPSIAHQRLGQLPPDMNQPLFVKGRFAVSHVGPLVLILISLTP